MGLTKQSCEHGDKVANLVDRFEQWKGYDCPYCEIERLTRELAEARDLIAHAIGGSDEARLRERNAALEGALRLILPLAKGYAPENQSDSARHTCNSWVVAAEDVLNDPIQVEPSEHPFRKFCTCPSINTIDPKCPIALPHPWHRSESRD